MYPFLSFLLAPRSIQQAIDDRPRLWTWQVLLARAGRLAATAGRQGVAAEDAHGLGPAGSGELWDLCQRLFGWMRCGGHSGGGHAVGGWPPFWDRDRDNRGIATRGVKQVDGKGIFDQKLPPGVLKAA